MKRSIFIGVALLMTMSAFGQNGNLNLDKSQKALQGYDPVSYFTKGKAEKGKREISHTQDGVVYWFQNKKNKDLFKNNPSKYPIEYGGWCAYAMGLSGEKVKIDPETFKITDGKLYLFYNFYFNNTLTKWDKDEDSLKPKADQNWNKILKL